MVSGSEFQLEIRGYLYLTRFHPMRNNRSVLDLEIVGMGEGGKKGLKTWARAVLYAAAFGTLLLPFGALGTRFGAWDFGVGFIFLGAGTLITGISLIGAVVGFLVAIKNSYPTERNATVLALIGSSLALSVVGVQLGSVASVPPIHNISTDIVDPPQFRELVGQRVESGANPLVYDSEVLGPQQQLAYPWITTKTLNGTIRDRAKEAAQIVENMGMDLASLDIVGGVVEATDTTFWFGFKDDVVIRLRSTEASKVQVDVGSISRARQSDLGVNARRITEILARFKNK
mgnify:CR=1 FL=1